MFNLFGIIKSNKYHHQQLGSFKKSQGCWNGLLDLDMVGKIPLLIHFGGTEPDSLAIATTVQFSNSWGERRKEIQETLYKHYLSGPTWSEDYPRISLSEIWNFVSVEKIVVEKRRGKAVIEVAIRVEWDEEHTLGARIIDGKLDELCGSI